MENSTHRPNGQEWITEVRLRTGSVVRFRHVRPEDEPLIAESIRTASRETLLHRFFSPIRKVSPDLLRKLLAIDRTTGACIVGVTSEDGKSRIICGARYVRLEKPGSAEIAITVHDDFQRLGLGSLLMKILIELARAEGIHQFEADVMTSNNGMLQLLRKFYPTATRWHRAGDVYHITMNVA